MSYNNPTQHEIRISSNLQKVAKKLNRLLKKETGEECYFILSVSSKEARDSSEDTPPVGSYVGNMDRETSALLMLELIAKWEANKELPPIHELRDANGKSLNEILGMDKSK